MTHPRQSRKQFVALTAAEFRRKRKELQLSQAAVAAGIGVSAMSVSVWERGVSLPNSYLRAQLDEFFASKYAERAAAARKKSVPAMAAGNAPMEAAAR